MKYILENFLVNIIDKFRLCFVRIVELVAPTKNIKLGIWIILFTIFLLYVFKYLFEKGIGTLLYGLRYKKKGAFLVGLLISSSFLLFVFYLGTPNKPSDVLYDYANLKNVNCDIEDFYKTNPNISLYCSSAYKDKNIEAKEKEETWFDYVCSKPYKYTFNFLQKMIDMGYDIERRSCNDCIEGICENENCIGVTPLILACKHGNIEACEILIENGADINAKDSNGNCAVIYLLDEPLLTNKGYTYSLDMLHLMNLTENGFTKENEEKILNSLDSGEIVSQIFEYVTHEPLSEKDKQYIREVTKDYNLDTLTCLYYDIIEEFNYSDLDKDNLYDYFNTIDNDTLSVQIMSKDVTSLETYFEKYSVINYMLYVRPYFDLTIAEENESTWFDYLVVDAENTKDRLEKLKLFLERGYDIERRSCYYFDYNEHEEHTGYEDICNLTPLMQACKKGNFETVKFLVEHGADINAINDDNCVIDYVFKEECSTEEKVERMQLVYYLYQKGLSDNSKHNLLEKLIYENLELLIVMEKGYLTKSSDYETRLEIEEFLSTLSLEERLIFIENFIQNVDSFGEETINLDTFKHIGGL